MLRLFLFNILFCLPVSLMAQYQGLIVNNAQEPIKNAKIVSSNGEKLWSDEKGSFTLQVVDLPFSFTISNEEYKKQSIEVTALPGNIQVFTLDVKTKNMGTVVVTAGRRDQAIEEVPISIEIIKPALIANKGFTNLAQAVNQSPGVYSMDGQVSIRGGGGYAYGAGSRVMLLWNGIPMLSPDIGDAKWNAVPMEQASQIEILKGASSVLYGSGALNGIIALNEKEPGPDGELRAKVQSGFYGSPKRESLKWWNSSPLFHMTDIYYGKAIKNYGYTFGANVFQNEGFRQGEFEKRLRINGSFYFRPKNEDLMLKAGISYNLQLQDMVMFILWKNDSSCYQAMDNTLSQQKAIRVNVDPYVKFIDKHKNIHHLKTRYYLVTTGNDNDVSDASFAQMYYLDYQFQKKFKNKSNLTAGATNTFSKVQSYVFGDHINENAAAYTQYELKSGNIDWSAGMRLEYCKLDQDDVDSKFKIGNFTSPIYPIFRSGFHYEPVKGTHLRASLGQGIRFPSIAERFVSTSVGGLIIFKNPFLKPETGYAAEIGGKQIIKLGDWKAMVDVAAFLNQYSNMTEFSFGAYNPLTGENLNWLGAGPASPEDSAIWNDLVASGVTFNNCLGFKATNAERARITGVEFSFNSAGKIGEVELTSLIGYTYMKPVSLNKDSLYRFTFSDNTTDMLKYRFNHMAKADIEATYKRISIGISGRYNSFMKNIDRVFEQGIGGTELLVGLEGYRDRFNRGTSVFDTRIGYHVNEDFKINFIANNFLNTEYVSRPGDVQAPRNFVLQMQWGL